MSGNGKSWFDTGFSAAVEEQSRRELGSPPDRFWLKGGQNKDIIFVDDSPCTFDEHLYKGNDGRFNHITCAVRMSGECAADADPKIGKADKVGHLTIVDLTGWQDKEGNWHRYHLVEMCPKTKTMLKLKLKKERKGTLLNQVYNVGRTDVNAPNCGDEFEYVRDVQDASKLYELVTYKGKNIKTLIDTANGSGPEAARTRKYLAHHFQIPESGVIPEVIPAFNYATLHQPLDPVDLKRVIASAQPMPSKFGNNNSQGGTTTAKVDEEIPF